MSELDPRAALREAQAKLAAARKNTAAARGAFDRATAMRSEIEAERDRLLEIEADAAKDGAASLVSKLKAGIMRDSIGVSRGALDAKMRMAEVDHKVTQAILARNVLDAELESATNAEVPIHKLVKVAAARVLMADAEEFATRMAEAEMKAALMRVEFATLERAMMVLGAPNTLGVSLPRTLVDFMRNRPATHPEYAFNSWPMRKHADAALEAWKQHLADLIENADAALEFPVIPES